MAGKLNTIVYATRADLADGDHPDACRSRPVERDVTSRGLARCDALPEARHLRFAGTSTLGNGNNGSKSLVRHYAEDSADPPG